MRQPQDSSASFDSTALQSRNARLAISVPAGTPICTHDPYRPRLSAGACSTAISTAPPHSPPRARPCITRKVSSRMGAQMPIER